MITISEKKNCCGCSACAQRCPKQCISMEADTEGFLYPIVDKNKCIDCGHCEKVCPVLNPYSDREPLHAYAAINKDKLIRNQSSSGGIFSILAEKVICEGGVVFGARFNENWQVIIDYTETIDGLSSFRGSKYVQAIIDESFSQCERFLRDGRKVLFSGTPCQISGLRHFLKKDYCNLFTIEIACHGVPSPKVWDEYIKQFPLNKTEKINMRDKITGWSHYSISLFDTNNKRIFSERASMNKYLYAYSKNLIIRQSCFNCHSKAGRSGSDLLLSDFWGIEKICKNMNDDLGTSFMGVYTDKGSQLLNGLDIECVQVEYGDAILYNPCIADSTNEPEGRNTFMDKFRLEGVQSINKLELKNSHIIKRFIKRILHIK